MAQIAVELRCIMLRQLDRGDASRFVDFRTCCDTGAESIATLCSITGCTGGGNTVDGHENGKDSVAATPAGLHRLTARLRGSVRRLAEADEAFWNAEEHAGAQLHHCVHRRCTGRRTALESAAALQRQQEIFASLRKRLWSRKGAAAAAA